MNKKPMTASEMGQKGGSRKGIKKGFAANPEKAREAQRKSVESRRKRIQVKYEEDSK